MSLKRTLYWWLPLDFVVSLCVMGYAQSVLWWNFGFVVLIGWAFGVSLLLAPLFWNSLKREDSTDIIRIGIPDAEALGVATPIHEDTPQQLKTEPQTEQIEFEEGSRPFGKDFCPSCGKVILPKGSVFCGVCGFQIKQGEEVDLARTPGTQLATLDPNELPTRVYDDFGSVKMFLDTVVRPLDARLEGAKASKKRKEISDKKFMELMREQQGDVNAMVEKIEGKLKMLGQWRGALEKRHEWAYAEKENITSKKWGREEDEKEVLNRRRDRLELQMKIVSSMLNWEARLEIACRLARDELDRKMREAFLASIPETSLVVTETEEAKASV